MAFDKQDNGYGLGLPYALLYYLTFRGNKTPSVDLPAPPEGTKYMYQNGKALVWFDVPFIVDTSIAELH